MYSRLHSKWQHIDFRLLTKHTAITSYTVLIYCKNSIKKRGTANESIKMYAILLVPENAWNSKVTRAINNFLQILVGAFWHIWI